MLKQKRDIARGFGNIPFLISSSKKDLTSQD
jgi:hypothetical protein